MANAATKKHLTLTEVSKRTKISMPTLQRYKKLYQDRIPSEGEGRKQRYPEESLAVFRELKKENIGRRGRPRKNAAPAGPTSTAARTPARAKRQSQSVATRAAAKAKPTEGLLTLTQVSKMTKISYPTLLRYVKNHLSDIPHKGTGRARRFQAGAVAVFKSLRQRSKRGRKSKAVLAAAQPAARATVAARSTGRRRGRPPKEVPMSDVVSRIMDLEKSNRKLERLVERLQKRLDRPIRLVGQR